MVPGADVPSAPEKAERSAQAAALGLGVLPLQQLNGKLFGSLFSTRMPSSALIPFLGV